LASDPPAVVRAATFNARHGAVGRAGITFRHGGLLATCRSLDADVLALQELDRGSARSLFRDQPTVIARHLGMDVATAPARRTPVGGWQCNAICARGVVGDVAVVELPRRAGHERRVALLATVRTPGLTVSVACTHLQHRGGAAPEQLAFLLHALDERPAPRLLAGDLNLEPPAVEPLLGAHGYTAAPSGPTSPARAPRRRIDWIAATSDLELAHVMVPEPVVSDHRPVVAEMRSTP